MNRVREFLKGTHELWRATIEWRCPATAPYLIVINTSFWASVFYCDPILQSRLLVSLSAGIFGYDILLSSSNDRSIAMHIFIWPFLSVWRTVATITSLYSWHSLQKGYMEMACWLAYSTVACLLISPAWTSYEINRKVLNCGQSCVIVLRRAVQVTIIDPVISVYNYSKYCVLSVIGLVKYIVCLQFIPPIWQYAMDVSSRGWSGVHDLWKKFIDRILSTCYGIRQWWNLSVIKPIYNGYVRIYQWLRYWVCAHWWTDFKAWIKRKVLEPCCRGFDCVCFCVMYVVCCRWLPPLLDWMQIHLGICWLFVYRRRLVPLKRFLAARLEEFRAYLRRQLHRLAVAIRDSVIWPICLLMVAAGRELSLVFYRMLVAPVLRYFYQRYKIIETTLLIYFLGPVCEKIVNNIPEKSPFCEDSDVELEGLLPEENQDDIERQNDVHSHSSRATSPIEEEENDFIHGLVFPTIDASESSDEEFDLHKKARPGRKLPSKKRRPVPDDVVAPEEDFLPSVTLSEKQKTPFDDDFEELR